MKFSIRDYGLTADELDGKYNPEGDGQHPEYTRADWRAAVENEDTISGYWEWVRHQLLIEEDELGWDNPYTQYEQQEAP
jgi:hypothetical protein